MPIDLNNLPATIFLHESAHAVVAWRCGLDVHSIQISADNQEGYTVIAHQGSPIELVVVGMSQAAGILVNEWAGEAYGGVYDREDLDTLQQRYQEMTGQAMPDVFQGARNVLKDAGATEEVLRLAAALVPGVTYTGEQARAMATGQGSPAAVQSGSQQGYTPAAASGTDAAYIQYLDFMLRR
ncbi:M50 family metallopeptidase [Gemmata sp.]|uniref:M50 family metallopeptidase n=1 Tax=Gemmata sp. TaxID=1914242 RepID=UPI003F6FC2EE